MRSISFVLHQDPVSASRFERVEIGEGLLDHALDARTLAVTGKGRKVNDSDESAAFREQVAESHRAERILSRFM
jgi:hypothetical protein